jgi:hypothetical protein
VASEASAQHSVSGQFHLITLLFCQTENIQGTMYCLHTVWIAVLPSPKSFSLHSTGDVNFILVKYFDGLG